MPQCEFERDKLVVRLDICFSAEPGAILAIVEAILAITTDLRWTAVTESEIYAALRRAFTAALSGWEKHRSREVRCCVACDQELGSLILLRNPGKKKKVVPLPSRAVGEKMYSEHGRGIYLINQLYAPERRERGNTEIHVRENSLAQKRIPGTGDCCPGVASP